MQRKTKRNNDDNPDEIVDADDDDNGFNENNGEFGEKTNAFKGLDATASLKLKDYINKLNRIIEAEMQPVSKRFESFEKTISVLESIKNKIPVDSYDYAIAHVEWARAKRLLVKHIQNQLYFLIFLSSSGFYERSSYFYFY